MFTETESAEAARRLVEHYESLGWKTHRPDPRIAELELAGSPIAQLVTAITGCQVTTDTVLHSHKEPDDGAVELRVMSPEKDDECRYYSYRVNVVHLDADGKTGLCGIAQIHPHSGSEMAFFRQWLASFAQYQATHHADAKARAEERDAHARNMHGQTMH